EALRMIFEGAETEGLEADARLTAMWLWTLAASSPNGVAADDSEDTPRPDSEDGGTEGVAGKARPTGFILEFDAARKIAQGLGARLEELSEVVQLNGDKARLLSVVERTKHLFGKSEGVSIAKKAAKQKQMTLFAELEQAAEAQGWGEIGAPKAGTTT